MPNSGTQVSPEQAKAIQDQVNSINRNVAAYNNQKGGNLSQLTTVPTATAPSTAAQSVGASSPTHTTYASDSSSVIAGENKTVNDLQSFLGQTGDIKSFVDTSMSSINDIDQYMNELEERGFQDVNNIRDRYRDARADTIEAQRGETGATNTAITTRLGGYLGSSGSAVGAMNNLSASHRVELRKLDAQRDAAIQAAQNAITDKNFALARMKADEIKSLSEGIYKRQQDFLDNVIKVQNAKKSMSDYNKDYLDTLAKTAGEDAQTFLDPERASEIDSFYGVPGFTAQYLSAAQKSVKASSDKERFESFKSYMDLLQSIPQGMQVPFGDEIVTGIGKTSDIDTFKVEDKAGNVRIISYNKGSGQFAVNNMGAIGVPSGGGGLDDETKSRVLSGATVYLQTAVDEQGNRIMGSDGKVSASGYLELLNQINKSAGQPGVAYVNSVFLNPSQDISTRYFDDEDLNYIREKTGYGAGYGAIPQQ